MGVSSQYVASSASIADGAVSEAKLAAEACSAAKMKKEGTATHVLTSNGAGAVPSYQAVPSAATGALTFVASSTFTSNACTFSGLTGDYAYLLLISSKADQSGNGYIYLEGDTNNAHYTEQWLSLDNTTIAAQRVAECALGSLAANVSLYAQIYVFRDENSYIHWTSTHDTSNTSARIQTRNGCKSDTTHASISSIGFKHDNAGTAQGKAFLYKIAKS